MIATSMALAKKLGKVGVLVGNCRGFVGNRMFGPYLREAQFLVEEGATVEAVDQALYDFGMAMGPLAVATWPGWTSVGASAKSTAKRATRACGSRSSKIACARWEITGKVAWLSCSSWRAAGSG